jgi:hypothetical protein
MIVEMQPIHCSKMSRGSNEQMFATAPSAVAVWFLLEYPEPWGANALQDSRLSRNVKQFLTNLLNALPGSRLQLIKQRQSVPKQGLSLFVVQAKEQEQDARCYLLDSYERLLAIDIAAIAAGTDVYSCQRSEEPLFLVCTNGSRDPCCGKWGIQTYSAVAAVAGTSVWQTTHTGGHRFAATMICLPSGICYGRVEADEAHLIVDSAARNQIYRLDRYRGRCCYNQIAQAADYFLRDRTGVYDASAFQLTNIESAGDRQWIVHFLQADNGTTHRLRIDQEMSASPDILSCRTDKAEFLPKHTLGDYLVGS